MRSRRPRRPPRPRLPPSSARSHVLPRGVPDGAPLFLLPLRGRSPGLGASFWRSAPSARFATHARARRLARSWGVADSKAGQTRSLKYVARLGQRMQGAVGLRRAFFCGRVAKRGRGRTECRGKTRLSLAETGRNAGRMNWLLAGRCARCLRLATFRSHMVRSRCSKVCRSRWRLESLWHSWAAMGRVSLRSAACLLARFCLRRGR